MPTRTRLIRYTKWVAKKTVNKIRSADTKISSLGKGYLLWEKEYIII